MNNTWTISAALYTVIAVTVSVLLVWLHLAKAKTECKNGESNIKLPFMHYWSLSTQDMNPAFNFHCL
jgi:hypothetical protein